MRGRETWMWERNIDRVPLMGTLTKDWPVSQACAPTGNQTGDPLLCRTMPNQLSYTDQGSGNVCNKCLYNDILKHELRDVTNSNQK